jgi:hypothetical protein
MASYTGKCWSATGGVARSVVDVNISRFTIFNFAATQVATKSKT